MRYRLFAGFSLCFLLSAFAHADCRDRNDHRSDKTSGFLITDFIINGTQKVSSSELARIQSKMIGSCFDESPEELEERVRALFQDRGYFDALVKSVSIKPHDPLARPKPATLEVEVLEGPRYKVAAINFEGNQVFNAAKLRNAFPLKKGDRFERDKVSGGLDTIRKLYVSDGFIDLTLTPAAKPSDGTVVLTLTVKEGPQYRMGKLEIIAKKGVAERLQARWRLSEGAVFDLMYIDKYISENRRQLPIGFARDGVHVIRNCSDISADVMLAVEPNFASQSQPKDVECDPPDGLR